MRHPKRNQGIDWFLCLTVALMALALTVSPAQPTQALVSTGEFRVTGNLPGTDVKPPTGEIVDPPEEDQKPPAGHNQTPPAGGQHGTANNTHNQQSKPQSWLNGHLPQTGEALAPWLVVSGLGLLLLIMWLRQRRRRHEAH